jgi:hypothetical protein
MHLLDGKSAPSDILPQTQKMIQEIITAGDGGKNILDHVYPFRIGHFSH